MFIVCFFGFVLEFVRSLALFPWFLTKCFFMKSYFFWLFVFFLKCGNCWAVCPLLFETQVGALHAYFFLIGFMFSLKQVAEETKLFQHHDVSGPSCYRSHAIEQWHVDHLEIPMEHLAHEPPCCYLCAIYMLSRAISVLSHAISVLSLCYLCAISVLSILSCSRTAFFVRAISVLSLCYLCSLALKLPFLFVLSLCYLCAIYAISCWGILFPLCYLCAISVLSMLSHAISVLSLCYLYDISRKFASTYTNSGLATSAQDWFNLLTSRVESSPAHELSFLMGIHRYIHIQAVCPLSIHIYIYISEAVCPL